MNKILKIEFLILLAIIVLVAGCTTNQNNTQTANQVVTQTNNTPQDHPAIKECKERLTKNFSDGYRCIAFLGGKLESADSCEELENLKNSDGSMQDFKSICRMQVARFKLDATICSTINSLSEQQTDGWRNSCLIRIAAATKNKDLCLKVAFNGKTGKEVPEFYTGCISRIAKEAKDIDLCSEISVPDKSANFNCIAGVAFAKNDIQLCNLITGEDQDSIFIKNNCISQIVQDQKDWKLCEKITDKFGPLQKDICFRNIAFELKDESICLNMKGLAQQCIDVIKNPTQAQKIPDFDIAQELTK